MEEIVKVWVTFQKAASPYLPVTPFCLSTFCFYLATKPQGSNIYTEPRITQYTAYLPQLLPKKSPATEVEKLITSG